MSKTALTLENAKEAFDKAVREDLLSNDDIVELINHQAGYLNAVSPSRYAKEMGISPQAAYKSKHCKIILGKRFVCDNE